MMIATIMADMAAMVMEETKVTEEMEEKLKDNFLLKG
jgi:hypothetical protein